MSHKSVRQSGALARRKEDIKLYEHLLKGGAVAVELEGNLVEKKDITRKLKLAHSEVKTLEQKGIQ